MKLSNLIVMLSVFTVVDKFSAAGKKKEIFNFNKQLSSKIYLWYPAYLGF